MCDLPFSKFSPVYNDEVIFILADPPNKTKNASGNNLSSHRNGLYITDNEHVAIAISPLGASSIYVLCGQI